MIRIARLDYEQYTRKEYATEVFSDACLVIEPQDEGFSLKREKAPEGFLEKWNNRFRITNICVFDPSARREGVGTLLLERILIDAEKSRARMIVLETQSFNSAAISFYQKNGFEIIGFDRFAYSNEGPAENNMQIEMGKKL